MRASGLIALLLVSGCTLGAPPGFSGGNSWEFPLVTPLEGGPLLVPVIVHGHGPYLFRIDPDAPFSEIDSALASELDLRSGVGPEFVDEQDKARNMQIAEVNHVKLGTLSIDAPHNWLLVPVGSYNAGGHQVRGVIGRDVLADSLVFGFDRRAGMGYLATQKGFTPPPDATLITTRSQRSRVASGISPVVRRLTHAIVNGKERTVHVDLGETTSGLRRTQWEDTGLTPVAVKRVLIDETATRREVSEVGIATTVEIGGINASNVMFVPYVDGRWDDGDYDGTVGLDVFDGHAVWANWNNGKFYVAAEKETTAQERIARWKSEALNQCAAPACAEVQLLVPEAVDGVPADGEVHPVLAVSRGAEVADLALELLVEPSADLPGFVVIFKPGETQVSMAVGSEYAGSTFSVMDVSPFPRMCPGDAGACVYQLTK